MKQVLFILSILLTADAVQAEVIDRIAAVVNRHIITLGDIRQERLLRDFFGSKESKEDRAILLELIDARLIEEQISEFQGIEVTEAQVAAELNNLADLRGLPPEIVRQGLRRRLNRAEFFEVRFRQSLRATDEDLRAYYETYFVPAARTNGLIPIPPLEQVSDAVRNNVIAEQMTVAIEKWLEGIRRRSGIEVFE